MPPLCCGGLVKNSGDIICNKGLEPFTLVFCAAENTSAVSPESRLVDWQGDFLFDHPIKLVARTAVDNSILEIANHLQMLEQFSLLQDHWEKSCPCL